MANTVRVFRIVSMTMASFCLVAELAAQTHAFAQQPDRQLSFPEDRQVGVLELYPSNNVSELTTDDAESVPAFGLVAIPAGRFVNLKVGAAQELDFLERLPGDALQKLEIRKRRISKAVIDRISRFEKLQELRFDWCQFESDAFDDAAVLGDLLKLTVTSDEQSKQHQHSLATWLSRLPRMEYLYAKPALDAIAFKTIGGHPALKTITIDVDKGRQAIVFKMVQQLPSLTGLIVNVADDVSPRDLDRLAAVPNLELLTLVHGTVDGELLRNIGQRGNIQNLRLLVIRVGESRIRFHQWCRHA